MESVPYLIFFFVGFTSLLLVSTVCIMYMHVRACVRTHTLTYYTWAYSQEMWLYLIFFSSLSKIETNYRMSKSWFYDTFPYSWLDSDFKANRNRAVLKCWCLCCCCCPISIANSEWCTVHTYIPLIFSFSHKIQVRAHARTRTHNWIYNRLAPWVLLFSPRFIISPRSAFIAHISNDKFKILNNSKSKPSISNYNCCRKFVGICSVLFWWQRHPNGLIQ